MANVKNIKNVKNQQSTKWPPLRKHHKNSKLDKVVEENWFLSGNFSDKRRATLDGSDYW